MNTTLLTFLGYGAIPLALLLLGLSTITTIFALAFWHKNPLHFVSADYSWPLLAFFNSMVVSGIIAGGITALIMVYKIYKICKANISINKKIYSALAHIFFPITILLGMGQMIYVSYKNKNQEISIAETLKVIRRTFDAFPAKGLLATTVASEAAKYEQIAIHLPSAPLAGDAGNAVVPYNSPLSSEFKRSTTPPQPTALLPTATPLSAITASTTPSPQDLEMVRISHNSTEIPTSDSVMVHM